MKNILITTAVMIASIGCTSRNDAPPADEKIPVVDRAKKPIIEDEKEPTEKEKKPAEKEAAVPTDDFGLPLVIVMEVPEVPESISKPSPPIKDKPDEAPKKSRGWW